MSLFADRGWTGVVLAGGMSSRMGRDKALIEVDGITLLERAVQRLRPHVREVLVIGDPESYGHLHPQVLPDERPGLLRDHPEQQYAHGSKIGRRVEIAEQVGGPAIGSRFHRHRDRSQLLERIDHPQATGTQRTFERLQAVAVIRGA